jgi:MoxR-like ATPase
VTRGVGSRARGLGLCVRELVPQPSLVGRASELEALGKLVREVRRGGRLAVVEGEAGIGKSRLVEATPRGRGRRRR